jgi:hypothetical protein
MTRLTGALLVLCAGVATAGEKTYRHIEDGLGNCIWATHSLPKDKESTYADVRGAFKSPDKLVEHRCYYAKPLSEYLSEGRVSNSLRDQKKYWSQYILTGRGGELDQLVNIRQPWNYGPDVASFDQTRAILDVDNSNCVMKSSDPKTGSDAGCVDVEKALRAAAKGKFPITGHLCLDIFFEVADKVVPGTNEPVREVRRIAAGCFEYTVTK